MERLAASDAKSTARCASEPAREADAISPSSRFRERSLILLLTVSILVLGGFYASPMFRGRIPIHGDLSAFLLPQRDFYSRCVKQGEPFDWVPRAFGGYFGGGSEGYHPLTYLLYRWLPLDLAFDIEVFWPLAALAAGMVVFLRRYIGLAGGCMAALVATFSLSFNQYLHTPPMTAVLSHLPWFLAALSAAATGTTAARRWLGCAAIALVVGSQTLLGFPQSLWFSLLSGAIFAICMLVKQRAPWDAWAAVACGVVLGLGIGAVEVSCMYGMFQTSTRAVVDKTLLPYPAMPLHSFIGLIAPYTTSNSLWMNYFGAVPLALVLWWVTACWIRPSQDLQPKSGDTCWSHRPKHSRLVGRLSSWAFLVAVVTAWLSLGLSGKLYYLQLWLPGVGSFRAPYRTIIVTQFSVAILAGVAFAALIRFVRSGQKTHWAHLILPWFAAQAALLAAVWFDARANHDFHQHMVFATGPLLAIGAVAALTLAARGRQLGLFLLVLLTAVDLGMYSVDGDGRRLWRTGGGAFRHLPTYAEFVAHCCGPPTVDEGRVSCFDDRYGWSAPTNLLWLRGYSTINGYSPLYPKKALDYGHVNTLRVAGVAWVWQRERSESCVAGWGPVGPPMDGWWRHIPAPLPRTRMVSKVLVSTTPRKDLKKIDVDNTALVASPLEISDSAPGTAKLVEDRPGRIAVQVETPAKQLLVVSESYDDDWQVRVDDQPASLQRVNGDFFGCVVDKGKHRVAFTFASRILARGKAISGVALAIVLGMAVAACFSILRGRRLNSKIAPSRLHERLDRPNTAISGLSAEKDAA